MKGINISSCSSQASTSIISSMDTYQSSSPSQSSSSSFSSCQQQAGGGRAIDRHNPIITDGKRVTRTLSTPCNYRSVPVSPSPNHQKNQKKNKKSRKLIDFGRKFNNEENKEGDSYRDYEVKKNVSSRPSDLILIKECNTTKLSSSDYVNCPESSRYLLDDTSFLDVGEKKIDEAVVEKENNSKSTETASASTSVGSSDDHQVVVLSVSLHCKGCEGKVRKHISRMEGVTSFNVDFAAKKVTVAGNVTPLGILASISKVKNARILGAPPISSFTPSVKFATVKEHA